MPIIVIIRIPKNLAPLLISSALYGEDQPNANKTAPCSLERKGMMEDEKFYEIVRLEINKQYGIYKNLVHKKHVIEREMVDAVRSLEAMNILLEDNGKGKVPLP